MNKIFGLPMDTLMFALLVLFGLGVVVMAVVALRDRVILKMAVRNIPRRPAQSSLIIVGLMLATLLFSASFSTGDTMTHSLRMAMLSDIGPVDEIVQATDRDAAGRLPYFSDSRAGAITQELQKVGGVAGVVAIAKEAAPTLAPGPGLSEPSVDVLGLPPDYADVFGPLTDTRGAALDLAVLGGDQVYVSAETAKRLEVATGDTVQVFLGQQPTAVRVAGIYAAGAYPAAKTSLVLPLPRLQELTGTAGTVNAVLVDNTGDTITGAVHSDAVTAALKPVLDGTGLEATPVKQDQLKAADSLGTAFSGIFLLFAQFSIAAGILLIFLIFVMLAAERKHELGMARAVGAQRGHVIRLFALEGALYALVASAVGSLLGIAVGWGMVRIMAVAFGSVDLQLSFMFNWRSVVIAYTLGVVLTFLVVLLSSWRVSRLNIVRAVRDLPEPKVRRHGRRVIVQIVLLLVIGVLASVAGLQGSQAGVLYLGFSLCIIGLALLARRLGAPDRVAFTAAGVALIVLWLLPSSVTDRVLPNMNAGIEMFFLSGIMLVIAAVWVVVFNSDLLVRATVAVLGRFRSLPPILKTAVAYPMQNRFRTGMTLAMFSLVVFTLVCMSFIIAGIGGIYGDTVKLAGGFDVRASTSYANPVADLQTSVSEAMAAAPNDPAVAPLAAITSVGTVTGAMVEARDARSTAEPARLLAQGIDAGYAKTITYDFALKAPEFTSAQQVWQTLQSDPNTVVVSSTLVPSRANYSMGAPAPPFQLQGFYLQDGTLPDVAVEIRDPAGGKLRRLRVIGVLSSTAFYAGQLMTSSSTLADLYAPQPVPPIMQFLTLKAGSDPVAVSKALEKRFLTNGMQAESMAAEIRMNAQATIMINTLLQGFMALGLVVGIASLGVVAARAVVERRKEIGVLRAIGFQKGMVQSAFLLESSFVALLGIGMGVVLGFGVAPSIISSMKEEVEGLQFTVPWKQLLMVILVAYAASLVTTYLPARQAARVYPAEALRYE